MNHTRVITFDIDGDNDLDIAMNSETKQDIIWFENLGDGEFSELQLIWQNISTGEGLDYADVDLDGDNDVIISPLENGNMAWFENDGNGNFSQMHEIVVGNISPGVFDVADLDSDGDPDILASVPGSTFGFEASLIILENTGNGDFLNPETLIQGLANTRQLELHYVNEDNLPDIMITGIFGGLGIRFNTGDMEFNSSVFGLQGVSELMQFKAGDIDNDGDLDFCGVTDDNDLDFRWWEQTEEGDFEYRGVNGINFLEGSTAIDLFDIDNDGDLDVLGSYRDSETEEPIVSWFEFTGGEIIAFEAPQPFNEYKHRTHLILSEDFTGNGFEDVLELSLIADKVLFTPHMGNGNFQDPIDITRNFSSPQTRGTYDVDGDGKLEILISSYTDSKIGYLPNTGNGNFGEAVLINDKAYQVIDFTFTDFDGDGDDDVIWISATNTGDYSVNWIENLGNLIFGMSILLYEVEHLDHHFFDADDDGDKDMIYDSLGESNLIIAYTQGDGTVEQVTTTIEQPNIKEFTAGDIDNDGDLDILLRSGGPDFIHWYENLGGMEWSDANGVDTIGGTSISNPAPLLEDFDNDGNLDILAHTETFGSDNLSLYINDGQGGFGEEQIVYARYVEGVAPYRFTSADMNLDGNEDIILSINFFSEIVVLPGNGDGTFEDPLTLPNIPNELISLFNADLDNDGDVDLYGNTVVLEYGLFSFENFLFYPGQARGRVFFDDNQNGLLDSLESGLNFINVYSQPEAEYTFSYSDGRYELFLDNLNGPFAEIIPEALPGWEITSDSASYTLFIDEDFTYVDSLDFGFYPDSLFTDLAVNLTGGYPRCNTPVNYWLNITNQGTNLSSGLVHLELNDLLSFQGSDLPPDSIVGNDIYWHFDSLNYFESRTIIAQVEMPDFTEAGSFIQSDLQVTELNDTVEEPFSATDSLIQLVVCAYDPNDKSVNPAGEDSIGTIEPDQELTYLIRFQNTGTDTAITVIIEDQLSAALDYSSFEPVSSSHEMQTYLSNEGELEFAFYNIMLPDSNVNFLGSQGYVEFRIQPLPGIAPNTEIFNTAEIFFDFNPAIVTNTVQNTINCYLEPEPFITFSYPVLQAGDTGSSFQWYFNGTPIEGSNSATWVPEENGTYTVEIVDENACSATSAPFDFNSLSIEEASNNSFKIYPNPSDKFVFFDLSSVETENALIQIFDELGREVFSQNGVRESVFSLSKETLGAGFFVARISDSNGEMIRQGKFVVR